jgi:hypothetical protein
VDAVVDAVLGMLLNERDRRNELRVDYGDWSGEEYVARWFPFWMVKEHEPPGGGKVFMISEETVNLYLNAFDMDLADHQAFIEGLTRSQLARGRIDKAAASAEQALLKAAVAHALADVEDLAGARVDQQVDVVADLLGDADLERLTHSRTLTAPALSVWSTSWPVSGTARESLGAAKKPHLR